MVKKKKTSKGKTEESIKEIKDVFSKPTKKKSKKLILTSPEEPKVIDKTKEPETLKIVSEKEISLDFATKVYKKFSTLIKAVVLFGSVAKKSSSSSSDIDIILVVDDASVYWDNELIVWYREELGKIMRLNPYPKSLHINTIKLTSWWQDLLRGDPVIINVLRYGEAILDFGGFFNPLKILLQQGKIKSTPEAIYTALQRAPLHLARSKTAELNAIEGIYWAMVDSAHAALMAAKRLPPSPEHVPIILKETFVETKMLKMAYVVWYRDIFDLHRKVAHGHIRELRSDIIDVWQKRALEFIDTMAKIVNDLVKIKD